MSQRWKELNSSERGNELTLTENGPGESVVGRERFEPYKAWRYPPQLPLFFINSRLPRSGNNNIEDIY